MVLKNERGQTLVEYILLFAVALSLIVTFYNSEFFKRLFGEQGTLGTGVKRQAEFGYRHAHLVGSQDESNQPFASAIDHSSYYNSEKSQSRFFGPSDPYQ